MNIEVFSFPKKYVDLLFLYEYDIPTHNYININFSI